MPECICDEPFRVGECPVHPPEKVEGEEETDQYANEINEMVYVTAAHRSEPTKKTGWVGFSFFCDKCGAASIMEWFNYCPSCGSTIKFNFPEGTNTETETE